MRTTIILDDSLYNELMQLTEARTKTEAVNSAIKEWIKLSRKKKLLAMRGKFWMDDRVKDMRREDSYRMNHE